MSALPVSESFKLYINVVHESLNIMTGNDVISYFRSAANHVHMSTMFGHAFTVIMTERVTCIDNSVWQSGVLLFRPLGQSLSSEDFVSSRNK